jgi:hypothetical protein
MGIKITTYGPPLLDAGVGKQLGTDVLAGRVDLLDHVACGMGYDGLR